MKKKTIITLLTILLSIMVTFTSLLPDVKAINVEITSILPTTRRGKVGEEIRVIGTINTTNGLYRIWFGNLVVNETYAIRYKVDITFQVPLLPEGNYTITLQDDTTKKNDTTWFYIEPAFHITPELPKKPNQLQQGDSVVLHVNVTGGNQDTVYHANVTVELPSPLNITYSAVVTLTNTTDTGYGYANITYPDEALFQPNSSHTNYTGLYSVFFNRTKILNQTWFLAENSFFIGLTNASEYHREELMEIRALGYQPNETATITLTSLKTNKTVTSWMANASQQGIINTTWAIPWNTSIGNYNITITSENTTKPISDSQFFSVPGYQIDIYTRNLAGNVVSQILVEALDKATNTKYNATSEKDGLAHLSLEKGSHTLEAFWKKVKVGETQINITEEGTFNLTCQLTNLKITVKDQNENHMPFVHLNISYQYVTTKEKKVQNETISGETNLSGYFSLNSTLPHITYLIDASRYGKIFNANNNTIENLPAEKWFNITIICPTKTLTLNITEHHRNPLANARVELVEQMSGISYNKTTNDVGIAVIPCTFGKYQVKAYMNDIFLNETSIEVFNDTYVEVYCKLYNLSLSIKIVDYFGQPISNVNVTLQREGLAPRSSKTFSDGTVTFDGIIGGSLQITVYLIDQNQPSASKILFVSKSKTVEIKIEEYVMLAGFLIKTSQLITVIMIAVTVILILSIEVYRRKRSKLEKNQS